MGAELDIEKEELINTYLKQVGMQFGVRAQMVDNGLGALAAFTLVHFRSDEDGNIEAKPEVRKRAKQSVAYALTLADHAVFNALQYLPDCFINKKINDYSYLTIAFYLWLADQVSYEYDADNPKTHRTFLQACKEHGFGLVPGEKIDKEKLIEKFEAVLESLGITKKSPGVAKLWREKGQFISFGILNGQLIANIEEDIADSGNPPVKKLVVDKSLVPEESRSYTRGNFHPRGPQGELERQDILFGPYPVLAMLVSERQKFLGINTAVSAAFGNREKILTLRVLYNDNVPDEVKEWNIACAIDDLVTRLEQLTSGNMKREDKMVEAALWNFGKRPIKRSRDEEEVRVQNAKLFELAEAINRANALQIEHRETLVAIARYFPKDLLRLALENNFLYIFGLEKDVSNLLPQDIPGFTLDTLTRGSNAARIPRHELMCIALGDRQNLLGPNGEMTEEALRALAQSALHETMHAVVARMTPDEKAELCGMAHDLLPTRAEKTRDIPPAPEKYNVKSGVITTSTFADIFHPYSDNLYRHYHSFNDIDNDGKLTFWKYPFSPEEVICNVFSMWHTEPNRENTPLNTDKVRNFIAKIDEYRARVASRSHEPEEVVLMNHTLSHTRHAAELVRSQGELI